MKPEPAIRAVIGALIGHVWGSRTVKLALGSVLALVLALGPGWPAGAQSREDGGRPGGGGHAGQAAPGSRGGGYPERREPGAGYGGPGYFRGPPPAYGPEPYQPPRYPSAPPRRPDGAVPGWRPAQRTAPGLYGAYRAPAASLGWVIESIGRRSPGRVLDARVEDRSGRAVYRVLWLTAHGRRIDYIVDAETGAVIGGGQ